MQARGHWDKIEALRGTVALLRVDEQCLRNRVVELKLGQHIGKVNTAPEGKSPLTHH